MVSGSCTGESPCGLSLKGVDFLGQISEQKGICDEPHRLCEGKHNLPAVFKIISLKHRAHAAFNLVPFMGQNELQE